MKKKLKDRILKEAEYLISTKETIRNIAKVFNISKSTVHKDFQERLIDINPSLKSQVDIILQEHLNVRHLRGGAKTKLKYQKEQL